MATLKLSLAFPDGALVTAIITAERPNDDAHVQYNGPRERLPAEIASDYDRPNLLEYHWRKYAARIGATINTNCFGDWVAEDDVL